MTVDMTKWQDMARANAHIRPAGSGRMAGKICIVTGAAHSKKPVTDLIAGFLCIIM